MTTTRGLIDTSVFIGLETNQDVKFDLLPDKQLVSAITLGELLAGVHAATDADTRASRLRTIETVTSTTVLDVDREVAAIWARLRQRLRESGLRLNVNDVWIASTALAHGLSVYTQDADLELLSDLGGPVVVRV
jgi:predicted nucleic acid-binding protein